MNADALALTITFLVALVLVSLHYVPVATHFARFFNIIVTLAHESGHAAMALITFGGIPRIKLRYNTGGETEHYGDAGLLIAFRTLAGYLTPLALGAVMVVSILNGETAVAGWIIGVLAAFALIGSRSVVTFVFAIILLGFLFVANSTPSLNPELFCFFVGALLFIGGIVDLYWAARLTFADVDTSDDVTDFDILSEQLFATAKFWAATEITLAVGVLALVAFTML